MQKIIKADPDWFLLTPVHRGGGPNGVPRQVETIHLEPVIAWHIDTDYGNGPLEPSHFVTPITVEQQNNGYPEILMDPAGNVSETGNQHFGRFLPRSSVYESPDLIERFQEIEDRQAKREKAASEHLKSINQKN